MKLIMYYMKQLHRHSGMKLYTNMIGMVMTSFLESVGFLLLIPILGVSGILAIGQSNGYGLWILDELQRVPESTLITVLLGAYLVIVIGQNLINKMILIRNTEIQQSFSRKLRYDTYRAILRSQCGLFLE